ncbi:hypothetical protein SUDANB105_07067 [Streptomyces sp. enrichment culture]
MWRREVRSRAGRPARIARSVDDSGRSIFSYLSARESLLECQPVAGSRQEGPGRVHCPRAARRGSTFSPNQYASSRCG